ncbi:MAG: hypothetical protein JOZ01_03260 [Candidatus Eremiobacteraeota bacterium]|nr:hypothetical protein [Candidatus Eremiobacteraeota bacterium]
MEFVSKKQAYDAVQKLLLQSSAHDPALADLAQRMEMSDGKSRDPKLYQGFLDTITADPLSPRDALCAAAEFMEDKAGLSDSQSGPSLIADAKAAAHAPEDAPAFWNRWIALLASV